MFKKILIANRGESVRAAGASAKPNRMVSDAHVGDFVPMEPTNV